jgi:hypothetical protein
MMKTKLTTEKAIALVRFVAHLAWADHAVNAKEIDHVLQLRKKLRLPPELDTELQTILSSRKSDQDIYFSYSDLKKQFQGSRNFPTRVEDGRSTYIPPEKVDRLIAGAIFDLLRSDGEISAEEGEMITWLKEMENDIGLAKKKIFSLFPASRDNGDADESGAPALV